MRRNSAGRRCCSERSRLSNWWRSSKHQTTGWRVCHHSFLSWYNLLEAKRKGYLLNPKNFPELSEFLSSTGGSLILYFLIWWCFQNGVHLIRSHAYLGWVRELGWKWHGLHAQPHVQGQGGLQGKNYSKNLDNLNFLKSAVFIKLRNNFYLIAFQNVKQSRFRNLSITKYSKKLIYYSKVSFSCWCNYSKNLNGLSFQLLK
jgi:hypothetical protein